MYHQQPNLPGGFDGQVRLFPLPDLVCFPFTIQKLHVFESRYCEMLEDAIRSDQLICMATLEPGYQPEYYGRPPIARQVCIGQVAYHTQRPDRTYDLLFVGFWRALVESEITPVRSYRRANVQVTPEKVISAKQLGKSDVTETVQQLMEMLPNFAEVGDAFAKGTISLNGLADMLACHMPFDREFKLTLLAEIDPVQRIQLLYQKVLEQSEEVGDDSDDNLFSCN